MPEKKKKNTTKNTKKRNVKEKQVIVEEKKNKTIKAFITSTPFLLGVMIFLIIFIAFLGIKIYQKEKQKEESFDAHISIPVLKTASNFEFGVDASLLIEEKNREYIFKITNYRNDDMAQEEIPYSVVIENTTNAVISLTKEDSDEDLMTEQEKVVLEEVMPLSQEKEEVYYHLKITSFGELKENDFIQIQIIS